MQYNKSTRIISDGVDTADVVSIDGVKGLATLTPAHVCTHCSTSTILGADETWSGSSMEITNFGVFTMIVKASHDSATDGLVIEYSTDGENWDSSDTFTVSANQGKIYSFQCPSRYLRVSYTNGNTEQTYFRLQTILKPYYVKPSSHRIQESISTQDDAELVKSVLTAYNGTDFSNINCTTSSNLRVTDAENGLAISKGDVVNTSFVHKFGQAPDFDEGDGEVTIWDGANDSGLDLMKYVYSSSAIIDSISSSDGTDTQDVRIQGLDENWNIVEQTVTLDGQDRVALTTNLIRVFRARNLGTTDFTGNVYIFENVSLSSGVPTDKTKVRLIISDGNNQTLMSIFTIPDGYTGYLRDWYASTAGANKTASYAIRLKARPFGGVFQLKHITSISDGGTTYIQHKYEEPERFESKVDIEMTVECLTGGVSEASISAGFDLVLVANS